MSVTKKKELLRPWFTALQPGESRNGQLCPFCNGGTHEEKSFSITLNEAGVLLYNCHRSSCDGSSGAISVDGSNFLQVYTKHREHKVFDEPTQALDSDQIKFFEKVYGLKHEEIQKAGFLWVFDRQAVYQPVYAPGGHKRGMVVRRYQDKVLWSYKLPEHAKEPLISWYPGPEGFKTNVVVIVEDILSALKFSRYHNAVSLNTSHISDEAMLELIQWSKKQYLCLDRDATLKAIKHTVRWRALLNARVVPCTKDPKYWTDEQLKQIHEDL